MTRRIRGADLVAGFPALEVRKLLRRQAISTYWASKYLGKYLAPSTDASRSKDMTVEASDKLGAEAIARLVAQGLLTDDCSVQYFAVKDEVWGPTEAGMKFAQATAGAGLKRTKASEMLAGIIDRARTLNSDPSRPWSVTKLVVFGSYMNDPRKAVLGDLDLMYELTRRLEGEAYAAASEIERRRAFAEGFRPRNVVDQVFAGEIVFVRTLLGARQRLLRAQRLDAETSQWLCGKPHVVVFEAPVGRYVPLDKQGGCEARGERPAVRR